MAQQSQQVSNVGLQFCTIKQLEDMLKSDAWQEWAALIDDRLEIAKNNLIRSPNKEDLPALQARVQELLFIQNAPEILLKEAQKTNQP